MRTKLISLLVALCAASNLFAYDFKYGDLYYNITDDTNHTVEVTYQELESYNNYYGLKSVTIPATVYNGKTYTVTGIGSSAFSMCYGLTSVTIPSRVTSIGEGAFLGCTGLTSITIPNSVTSIGDWAFSGCTGLTSITIPNSVTSIGDYAFSSCTGLTSIIIPENITSIESGTFYDCTGLTSITIPNTVTSIDWDAFHGCTGLTSITIPNSVTRIEGRAFYGCTGLTSIIVESGNTVYDSRDNCNAIIETAWNTLTHGCKTTTIPNSVTSIGFLAFSGCTSLTAITIPNGVTRIGQSSFESCTGLTSITIPNSVTSIGGQAFYGCTGLTSITIPNSVIRIEYLAFFGCTGLTSITIPNSVMRIESSAFSGCGGLTSIVVESGNTVYDSRENCNAIIETATNTLTCGCQTTIIPESVTSIGEWAFYGCTGLTSVTIGNSVTSIGDYAFSTGGWLRSGLTEVHVLAKTPPELGSGAFSGVATNIPVYIPCGTTSAYKSADGWKDFTNYIEQFEYALVVTPKDSLKGAVRITQVPSCENDGVGVIEAIANNEYFFVQWDDGNTDNPRTVIVDKDTTFTAKFGGGVCTISATCDLQRGIVTGSGTYDYGTQITLHAIPNSGYEFSQWDNGLTYNPYRFTVLDDLTIEALFVPITPVEDIRADSSLPQKVLRNGQVYILRGGKVYTLTGIEVE